MEHKTFGKIVAALRKEQINLTNGNRWNQTDLAEETGLTPSLVGRIERGQQARLDGEILTQLASAFNLTSLERREFFAMASEVTDNEIVRADLCNEEVFGQVWALLDSLQTPAFLMDPFCDIIGANRSLIAFHNINITKLQAAKSTSAGINNLALLLSPVSSLRQILGHAWQPITLNNVQQ